MNEGFFLFLAKGAGICLFDTYFVQKVICGVFSVKEFKLEHTYIKVKRTYFPSLLLSSNHFPWLLDGIEAFLLIRHS